MLGRIVNEERRFQIRGNIHKETALQKFSPIGNISNFFKLLWILKIFGSKHSRVQL